MFTGIVESAAIVRHVEMGEHSNLRLQFSSSIVHELRVDQSVAHNGVCLTIVEVDSDSYAVDVIPETLRLTNIGKLDVGDTVNLERSMRANDRLDGHIVQGHVDTVATFADITDQRFTFEIDRQFDPLVVLKGSICLNGVSLTVSGKTPGTVSVDLIPYTLEHTNLGQLAPGDQVNVEFDILGKYVQNMLKGYAIEVNDIAL